MSRLDELRARFEAEARVLELEEQLIAAKEEGGDLSDLKHELRQARQEFRQSRDTGTRPDVIETVAAVDSVGGGE